MEGKRFEDQELKRELKRNDANAEHDDGFQHEGVGKRNSQNVHRRIPVPQAAAFDVLLMIASTAEELQRNESLQRVENVPENSANCANFSSDLFFVLSPTNTMNIGIKGR